VLPAGDGAEPGALRASEGNAQRPVIRLRVHGGPPIHGLDDLGAEPAAHRRYYAIQVGVRTSRLGRLSAPELSASKERMTPAERAELRAAQEQNPS